MACRTCSFVLRHDKCWRVGSSWMFPRGNWSIIYQSSRLNIPENWNFSSTALRTSDPVNEKYYYSTYHSTEWAIANGSIRRTCGRPWKPCIDVTHLPVVSNSQLSVYEEKILIMTRQRCLVWTWEGLFFSQSYRASWYYQSCITNWCTRKLL